MAEQMPLEKLVNVNSKNITSGLPSLVLMEKLTTEEETDILFN